MLKRSPSFFPPVELFVLVSGSERNAVNATLKEGRGGVRAIWAKCDLCDCGLGEVFQQIMTEHVAGEIYRCQFNRWLLLGFDFVNIN